MSVVPKYKLKYTDRPIAGNGTFTVRHNEKMERTTIEHHFGAFLYVDDRDWTHFVQAVNAANRRLLEMKRDELK